MFDFEPLNLKNMNDLNEEVERIIPSLIRSLDDNKKKASLTITLSFQRFKDSDSRIEVSSSVKPAYPSKKRMLLASMDLKGNLTADAEDLGLRPLPRQKSLIEEPTTSQPTGGNEA